MSSLVIGLTGQTGAGKSTVSEFALELGCKIINADSVAREALAPGSEVLKRLAVSFGSDIIEKDGSCKRRLLAQRAFSSRENTDLLNEITHPWIKRRISEYIEIYRRDGDCIILLDAPQLYESGCDGLCDTVIAVTAPEDIRMARIIERDGLTEEEAALRMKAQKSGEFFIERADHIIDGSLPLKEVKERISEIIKELT